MQWNMHDFTHFYCMRKYSVLSSVSSYFNQIADFKADAYEEHTVCLVFCLFHITIRALQDTLIRG